MSRSTCGALVFVVGALVVGARAPLHAQEPEPHPRIFHTLIGIGIALHGGDAMQTAYLLGAGTGHEGNPALAPFSQHPFWFGATKLGIAAGVSAAVIKLHRTHRWTAVALIAGEIALESYAVVHNNRLLPPNRR